MQFDKSNREMNMTKNEQKLITPSKTTPSLSVRMIFFPSKANASAICGKIAELFARDGKKGRRVLTGNKVTIVLHNGKLRLQRRFDRCEVSKSQCFVMHTLPSLGRTERSSLFTAQWKEAPVALPKKLDFSSPATNQSRRRFVQAVRELNRASLSLS